MKTRSDLEAEAMRLIRAVETNIVLDAKEVIVQALDRMQVEGATSTIEIVHEYAKDMRGAHVNTNSSCGDIVRRIRVALENREKP